LLLSHDPHGGYGHRDHVKVHQVGARAAQMTGTRVLEATFPRELVALVFCPMRLLRLVVRYDPHVIRGSYGARSAITHRINVRGYAAQKRRALAAHWSGARKGKGRATWLHRVMLALPVPVFGLFVGYEACRRAARLLPRVQRAGAGWR